MIFWLVARASFHAGRPIPKNMLSVSCAKHQGHHQLFSTLRTTGASHRGRLNRLNPLDPQFISPTPLFAELNQADQPNPPLEQPNRGLRSVGAHLVEARGAGERGPVEEPASATAARSSAESPIATAGRGGACECDPRRWKTPKGRFWMGNCEPAGTSTNDRSCSAPAIAPLCSARVWCALV